MGKKTSSKNHAQWPSCKKNRFSFSEPDSAMAPMMVTIMPMMRRTFAPLSDTFGVRRVILLLFFFVCPAAKPLVFSAAATLFTVFSVSAVMIVGCAPLLVRLRLPSESFASSTISPTGHAKANRRAMTTHDHTSFLSGLFGLLAFLLSAMVRTLLLNAAHVF